LGLIGLVWLMFGWALLKGNSPSHFGRLGPGLIEWALSAHWAGLAWVVCGLLALVTGAWRRMPDAYGFNALLIPPMLWTVLYGWSWGIWVFTRGEYGSARSWVQAVIWSCAVVVVMITSGWPDPDDKDR